MNKINFQHLNTISTEPLHFKLKVIIKLFNFIGLKTTWIKYMSCSRFKRDANRSFSLIVKENIKATIIITIFNFIGLETKICFHDLNAIPTESSYFIVKSIAIIQVFNFIGLETKIIYITKIWTPSHRISSSYSQWNIKVTREEDLANFLNC